MFAWLIRLLFPLAFAVGVVYGQAPGNSGQICERGAAGSTIAQPENLQSENGVLQVTLRMRNDVDEKGRARYCYVAADGSQSPTLRVKRGDLVVLNLINNLVDTEGSTSAHPHQHGTGKSGSGEDPCLGAQMTASSTNMHFHGLEIPPVCHQDETVRTSIRPSDVAFEYRFRIPADAPPGLYWYHPHPHGFSKAQVLGGASGALIVEGLEREAPLVAELPERLLIIRDQDLENPNAEPVHTDSMPAPQVLRDAEGDILNTGTGTGKPAKDLSINYVPVSFPKYEPARIEMKPAGKELWRVLNASAITYLDMQFLMNGRPQLLGVVALDGVPLHEGGNDPRDVVWRTHLLIPPAGRVEFIAKAPAVGVSASLVTRTVDTGPAGENDPTRPLATIVATPNAPAASLQMPAFPAPNSPAKHSESQVASPGAPTVPGENPSWVGNFPAVHARKLYFFEEPEDPANPNSPLKFYITVEGQTPKQFDMHDTIPNIVVQQGDVEEWTIENRTRELHAFHIHQIHFQLMEWNGVPLDEPFLRDTINVPYWDGMSKEYPSVKLKMDFRDPRIVGTFVYHCHLLEHEDGGMMGTVRVEAPAK